MIYGQNGKPIDGSKATHFPSTTNNSTSNLKNLNEQQKPKMINSGRNANGYPISLIEKNPNNNSVGLSNNQFERY